MQCRQDGTDTIRLRNAIAISHVNTLVAIEGDTQGYVHDGRASTLDPGWHLASFNVACLLPFYLSRVASHAAGC
jgi:hypothetical protein